MVRHSGKLGSVAHWSSVHHSYSRFYAWFVAVAGSAALLTGHPPTIHMPTGVDSTSTTGFDHSELGVHTCFSGKPLCLVRTCALTLVFNCEAWQCSGLAALWLPLTESQWVTVPRAAQPRALVAHSL
jgi:hypothetical protein